jgi:NADH:ubiquinone oxidoreductase subunit C
MLENTIDITTVSLLNEVASRMPQGFRFVTVTCLDGGDHHEIYYHFDKDYQLCNLRLQLPKGQPLPSISRIYFAAVLVENELQDLFGIKVADMVIDYGGRLLLTEDAPKAPLNKSVSVVAQPPSAVVVAKTPPSGLEGATQGGIA